MQAARKRLDPCVVCGWSDARAIFEVHLLGGERTTLCGSHALMHRRARVPGRTIEEVRAMFRERRLADRRTGEVDELGAGLAVAFAGERRAAGDRRA